jgi:hypothetical protein
MPEKPVLLICGCKKYEPYLHSAIQRLDIPSWRVIGILGDPTLSEAIYNKEKKVLTLPKSDLYEHLPAKIYDAMSWIMHTYPETPGIYKTDEDILYGDINQVAQIVSAKPDIPYWGIKTHICEEAPVNMYRISARFENKELRPMHPSAHYCYGLGYWISKAAIKHLLAAKEVYESAALEDVCTGSILNKAGIIPICIPLACMEVDRTPELLNFK